MKQNFHYSTVTQRSVWHCNIVEKDGKPSLDWQKTNLVYEQILSNVLHTSVTSQ